MRSRNLFLISFCLLCFFHISFSALYARDYVRSLKNPSSFTSLEINDAFKVNLHQGKKFEAKVYGTESDVNRVLLRIVDNKLVIRKIHTPMIGIRFEGVPRVEVTLPDLKSVALNGSGIVSSGDRFMGTKLSIIIAGSGNVSFSSLSYHQTNVLISGSGNAVLTGTSSKLDVTLAGSGIFNGERLKVMDAEVMITGSGEARPNVSNILNATVSGSGSVYYLGKPTVNRVITGSGDVMPMRRGNRE